MNELQTFSNAQFGEIRSITIDGIPYFVGRDVAKVLGYANTRDALAKRVDTEDKLAGVAICDTNGRETKPVLINESGLYSLILMVKGTFPLSAIQKNLIGCSLQVKFPVILPFPLAITFGIVIQAGGWLYWAVNGKMSNSGLVSYTLLSPNHSGKRTHSIDRITPHCVVGQLSAASICGCFTSPDREASCNYGIGKDGQIALCVDEGNRSWCSSSNANDQRAVTIECASDKEHPYAMTDAVYQSLIKLCVDICRRNGKSKLLWFGDKDKTLAYEPKAGEMVLTVHRWFANKACPGDWLYSRLGDLAAKVTAQLGGGASAPSTNGTLYRVQAGAFKSKENADRQLEKIKAAGFDTYMVQADGYYKIQIGAYSVKGNAENMLAKVKAAGFDAFITTEQGQAVSSTPAKSLMPENLLLFCY